MLTRRELSPEHSKPSPPPISPSGSVGTSFTLAVTRLCQLLDSFSIFFSTAISVSLSSYFAVFTVRDIGLSISQSCHGLRGTIRTEPNLTTKRPRAPTKSAHRGLSLRQLPQTSLSSNFELLSDSRPEFVEFRACSTFQLQRLLPIAAKPRLHRYSEIVVEGQEISHHELYNLWWHLSGP